MAPARAVAYRVIRRVFEQQAYADRALRAEAAGLSQRDRALATILAFGTVQRALTLDHVIGRLSNRPLERLDAPVVAALRLGLFGLLFLDRAAPHAVVADAVELVKREGRGGAGLVNAVLRRAGSEAAEIVAALGEDSPEEAALRYSVPEWLAQLWWRELGPPAARALLAASLEPAEAAVRMNTLAARPEEIRARLPVRARCAEDLPEGLVLEEPFDVHGSELFRQGALMPQSRGSMLVARVVAPEPRERVLDLCAAPGAKTTHLAALNAGDGEIVAVERHPGRARALQDTCARMGAENVRVEVRDATGFEPGEGDFARVLVDPPCSGLGTLASRPDLRWRASRDQIAELSRLQGEILQTGAASTAPGGTLTFSVCTITRAEGPEVIATFLRRRRDFEVEDLGSQWPRYAAGPYLQTRPDRDNTDGFFIARLRRCRGPRAVGGRR